MSFFELLGRKMIQEAFNVPPTPPGHLPNARSQDAVEIVSMLLLAPLIHSHMIAKTIPLRQQLDPVTSFPTTLPCCLKSFYDFSLHLKYSPNSLP